jgi:putative ATP-binding cassette transporter
MKKNVAIAAGAAAILISACATAEHADESHSPTSPTAIAFDEYRKDNGIPGLAAAVVTRGSETQLFVSGIANTRDDAPVTVRTMFHYYSVTKLFTSVAIMQLVERGQLKLDADVRLYLPEIDLRKSFSGEIGELSIENLLSHSSGFGRETDSLGFHMPSEPATPTDALLGRLLRNELKFRPGTDSRYSNINFALLAAVIERVTEKTFEAYMRDEVLHPLAMYDTDFAYSRLVPGVAASGYVGRWSLMDWMMLYLYPSSRRNLLVAGRNRFGDRELNLFELDAKGYGGMIGSIGDLAKFLAFQLDTGKGYDKILGADFRRLIYQRRRGYYALGWAVGCAGGGSLGHVGGGPGFKSYVCMSPERGRAVAYLTNKFVSADPGIGGILREQSETQPRASKE